MAMAMTIKLNRPAVRALLRDPAVRADLERRARAIAAAAGPGMEADSEDGASRSRATVWTETYEARSSEAKSRRLTSAIDAGR